MINTKTLKIMYELIVPMYITALLQCKLLSLYQQSSRVLKLLTNMRISPEYNLCSTNYTYLSPINILSKDYYSYILLKA